MFLGGVFGHQQDEDLPDGLAVAVLPVPSLALTSRESIVSPRGSFGSSARSVR